MLTTGSERPESGSEQDEREQEAEEIARVRKLGVVGASRRVPVRDETGDAGSDCPHRTVRVGEQEDGDAGDGEGDEKRARLAVHALSPCYRRRAGCRVARCPACATAWRGAG